MSEYYLTPLFGDIRDAPSGPSTSKVSNRMKSQPVSKLRGNSFATTIAPVQSVENYRGLKGRFTGKRLCSEVNLCVLL